MLNALTNGQPVNSEYNATDVKASVFTGKCIACQSKSTFFSISASSLTSKWVSDSVIDLVCVL